VPHSSLVVECSTVYNSSQKVKTEKIRVHSRIIDEEFLERGVLGPVLALLFITGN
jgi:hypothetical protein